jgi:hypothetical protein
VAVSASFLLVALQTSVIAEQEPAKSATDDALLESLDAELMDGLETVPDKSIEGSESEASATEADDDFTRIANRMREAARLIPKISETEKTKTVQTRIVGELEELIGALEKQCQQSSSSSSGKSKGEQQSQRSQVKPSGSQQGGEGTNSRQPARDSTERLGPDELQRADAQQMQGLLKDLWGQLPEKAREQMLKTSPEQFLPKYELMIEQYFKRLAEEQPPSQR